MRNLPTVAKAREEHAFLQEFILLAENYEETTLQQQIIKRYAYTSSIPKVIAQINAERELERLLPINHAYVTEVIRSKPQDRLHQMVRTQYMKKTKFIRKRTAATARDSHFY